MQAKATSQKVSSSSEQYQQPRSPQLLAPNGKSAPGVANGSHPSTSSSLSTAVAPLPPPSPAAMSPRAQGKAKAAPPSPLPTQQHLSHSHLFRTPSPPPASIDDLKGELNNEAGGLIPLAAIIERVASEAYDGLLTLGETMSSLPSSERRARIFDTALELRKQMIKLYVVIQWSRGANHMQHLKNINGLIHEQTYQTLDARDHLVETRSILPNARQRNHDVVTAVDVLSRGEPSRLPAAIEADSIPPKPFTDSEARQIVHELDEAIRVRLTCDELVPLRLKSKGYDVSDGRVRLVAPSLFSLSLTLSGAKEDDRWYLLTISFDYNITGEGKDRFPQDLWEAQREGFIATANEVLESRPPIVRLFNFLQAQALEYQLDILAYQVAELARLTWKGLLSWSWQERTLIIDYWTRSGGEASQASLGPVKGGRIKLAVQPRQKETAIEELRRVVDEGEEAEEQDEEGRERHLQLAVVWEADDALLPDRPDVAVDAQDLNVEALLLSVVTRHAEMAIDIFKQRILASSLRATVSPSSRASELVLELHATLTVCLSVDVKTGKLVLSQRQTGSTGGEGTLVAAALSQSSSAARLREANDLINASPSSLVDVLSRLQTAAIRSDVEQKASYLGLRSLRSLNLNQEEYTKFSVQPSQILYLPLEQCPTFHLAIVIRHGDLKAALISTAPVLYGATSAGNALEVSSLQWLDVDKIAEASRARALLSSLAIGRLHSYAVALTISSQLQSQLRMRGVAFTLLSPRKSTLLRSSDARAADLVPSMSAKSVDLFGSSAKTLLRPNAVVRLGEYWNPLSCYIEVVVKMRFSARQQRNAEKETAASLASVRFDSKQSTLSLRTQNLAHALDVFALEWQAVARIASLASELCVRRKGKDGDRFRLLDYDVRSARFAYGREHELQALLSWHTGTEAALLGQQTTPPGYRLAFSGGGDAGNPHARIGPFLESLLDASTAGGQATSPNWPAFLYLLDSTSPILSTLGQLRDASLEDATMPDVEWLSATWYRVIFAEEYRLDVRLAKGGRVMIVQDAASSGREMISSSKGSGDEGFTLGQEAPGLSKAMEAAAKASSGGALVLGQTMLCDLRRARGKVAEKALTTLIEAVRQSVIESEGL